MHELRQRGGGQRHVVQRLWRRDDAGCTPQRMCAVPRWQVRSPTGLVCEECPPGSYGNDAHTLCVQCPQVGVECTKGVLVVLPGYWPASAAALASGEGGSGDGSRGQDGGGVDEDTTFYRCPQDACTVTADGGMACAPGRGGPLCAVCLDDHFLQGTQCVVSHLLCQLGGLMVVVTTGWIFIIARGLDAVEAGCGDDGVPRLRRRHACCQGVCQLPDGTMCV